MRYLVFPEQNTIRLPEPPIKWLWRYFPNQESYIRFFEPIQDEEITILCSLNNPDKKILPLLFVMKKLKELGVKKIHLYAPYLAYMRQDAIFNEGELLSSTYFADIISPYIASLQTFDPHLHRIKNLDTLYQVPCEVYSATVSIGHYIEKLNLPNPIIIGPDGESIQWVQVIAEKLKCDYIVFNKKRYGDRHVAIDFTGIEKIQNHTPIIVDDVITSGTTIIQTISEIIKKRATHPWVFVTHALFQQSVYENIMHAGCAQIVSTNTIPHHTNRIDVVSEKLR